MKIQVCESVRAGHPDKLCDRISDTILDAALKTANNPKNVRCAMEAVATTGMVFVTGEMTLDGPPLNIEDIVRDTVASVGYNSPEMGYDAKSIAVVSQIKKQSANISKSVKSGDKLGAGDQGVMYGYACRNLEWAWKSDNIPPALALAHAICRTIDKRDLGATPDGKCQVRTITEDEDIFIDHVSISMATGSADAEMIKGEVSKWGRFKDLGVKASFNPPNGIWTIGGPAMDTGLTGRKIIVDTYGGIGRHGGGAFSGKDPTKVDRTGAYYARMLALQALEFVPDVIKTVEVQVSYEMGALAPLNITMFGGGMQLSSATAQKVASALKSNYGTDGSVQSVIDVCGLWRPIYAGLSAYGHFGHNEHLWNPMIEREE